MAVVAMKQLLEAGVHFGHQTRRWDPKMAEYIFQARNGIHIIDLQKTSKKLDEAYSFLKPGVIFLVDPKKERIAILEAKKLGIPVVGLVDTNCNPEEVDYAIPGNDDAIRAVKLIADVMANAVIEGKQGESFEPEMEEQPADEEATTIEEVVANEEEKVEE